MNELTKILSAYQNWQYSEQTLFLATVVNTQGSTYRRPGARLLLTSSGNQVGTISGGCLEADLFEWTRSSRFQGNPIVLTYDATADDEILWGLGLGCNGVAQVLLERLEVTDPLNPLTLLATYQKVKQQAVMATVFGVAGSERVKIGVRLLIDPFAQSRDEVNSSINAELEAAILRDVSALTTEAAVARRYSLSWGWADVLLEFIQAPTSLLIFGAGRDAVPVAQLAKLLGWQVTIVDCRASEATFERFPMVDRVILTRREILDQIEVDTATIAVVMTHNYLDDLAILKRLQGFSVRYLGIMGPRHRTERLCQEMQQSLTSPFEPQILHSPIGLDIGAETSEEIAIAIIAEIQAVLSDRAGNKLCNGTGTIHARSESQLSQLCIPLG